MAHRIQLLEKQFQAPCSHYFPDARIEKIIRRGESFFGIYDCEFCGQYENLEDISGLHAELREILENQEELERETAIKFLQRK